ncbi:MAG: hypothetical protein HW421_698 [Ignavibacteria bacterium]|nr:hypothetical protein [Ignavibacteria bacterium]
MIELKKAVKIAKEYFENVNETNSVQVNLKNVMLEEVFIKKYQDTPDCWYLTFGFNEDIKDDSEVTKSPLKILQGLATPKRKYRTIVIDPNGNFRAMKIREVEYA